MRAASQPVDLNRHRGLGRGELTRKYRHAREAISPEEPCEDHEDYDPHDYDYWDPRQAQTDDDYLALRALEESIGFALEAPTLGALLPGSASPCNRGATHVEHAVLARWLAATAPGGRNTAAPGAR